MKHLVLAFVLFIALTGQVWASSSETNAAIESASMSLTADTQTSSVNRTTFKERVAMAVVKKMVKKSERKARKRGIEAPLTSFADIVVLAAAVVVIVGIITIISSPIHGLIVALIGLLIYLLGKSAGGSLNNIL